MLLVKLLVSSTFSLPRCFQRRSPLVRAVVITTTAFDHLGCTKFHRGKDYLLLGLGEARPLNLTKERQSRALGFRALLSR